LITPIFDEPLLLAEGRQRVLVAADLHLGLEYELWQGGISIPSQTEKILARLMGLIARIEPDRLLLLGDVKHTVQRTSWQERREVPDFLRRLSSVVRVDIVPGNHDSSIADLSPPGVQVRPASGFVLDGVGYFHGHTWPDEEVMSTEYLVAGHLHPALRLVDPIGHSFTRPVWARGAVLSGVAEQQYGFPVNAQLIIVPAFNDLCGGLALGDPGDDLRGPLLSMMDPDWTRIYLLDGADLGLLSEIRAAGEKLT